MSTKGKAPPAKAAGRKSKEKKDTNKLSAVDKQFCELTISDLNQKLTRLRAHLATLDDNNVALTDKLRELEFDRTDVAAHLDRQLKEKEDTIVELVERLTEITKVRKSENEQSQQRISDLEAKYKAMHDQLTSEIKLLTGKLNSLDEFRAQRDILLSRFYDQDQQLKDKDREYKLNILEIEQKALVDKDALKKEVDERLLEVADDFMKAYEQRSSAYMNRLIRENFALRKELDIVIDTHIKMNKEFEEHKFKKKQMHLDMKNLQELNVGLVKKLHYNAATINRLNKQCDNLKDNVVEGLKYRTRYEQLIKADSCDRFTYEEAMKKLCKLGKKVEKLNLEKNNLLAVHEAQEAEIEYLQELLSRVKVAVEAAVTATKTLAEPLTDKVIAEIEERQMETRKNLMNELMNIMATSHIPETVKVRSVHDMQYTYHPGHLGFLPTEEKASLLDLFYTKKEEDESGKEFIPMKNKPAHRFDTTCATANEIFDVEVGSTYFVSSSVQEEIVEEQAHESADDEAESGSADEDKEDIICGKDEKAAEPSPKSSVIMAPAPKAGEPPAAQPTSESGAPVSETETGGGGGIDEDIAEFFFY